MGSDGDKKEKCVQVRDRERIIVCPQAVIDIVVMWSGRGKK